MDLSKIRNFVIIAHINHGKSTLADRILEITHTIEKRNMQEQVLDMMSLERERGITIKMAPVRMVYRPREIINSNSEYILNLIDTPGHADFSYEVSRSLQAVEGAVLLVDATKGIQAQTLANLELARRQELTIIPCINKIDLANADIESVKNDIAELFSINKEEIVEISAKTGKNVDLLLKKIIEKIPPPAGDSKKPLRALIFDSVYNPYSGVVAHARIVDGMIGREMKVKLLSENIGAIVYDVGVFNPYPVSSDKLSAGEIGYITTDIREIEKVRVGDTIAPADKSFNVAPLPGYKKLKSVVFASFYPQDSEKYDILYDAIKKLKLNDASLYFEKEKSEALGRGFKCGFLGLLHLDIIKERLKREYNLDLIITSPSVSYLIKLKNKKQFFIYSASEMPDMSEVETIEEPYVYLELVTPSEYMGNIMKLVSSGRFIYKESKYLSAKTVLLLYEAPLADIITDFYDNLKSVSSGYASMNYEIIGMRSSDLVRMNILIAGENIEALSRIVYRPKAIQEGRAILEKLKEIVPRQLFSVSLQAMVGGKVVAREDIGAARKDVTGYLYGGDYSRKKKLLEKQKKGKKKLKSSGKVILPPSVFIEIMKKS